MGGFCHHLASLLSRPLVVFCAFLSNREFSKMDHLRHLSAAALGLEFTDLIGLDFPVKGMTLVSSVGLTVRTGTIT